MIPAKARKLFSINAGDQVVVLGDESQGIAIIKSDNFLQMADMIRQSTGNGREYGAQRKMKVLIGTTNPSKVKRFEKLLAGCDIEFCTLKDLGINREPEESGINPEENAVIKAKYYGQFFDMVICNDSGLYFDALPLDDSRQPGLNIRTPGGSKRLDDEEMIEYYSGLVHSLGGKVLAYYLDGIAVYHKGVIHSFMENSEATRASAFYMVDTPSDQRHEGWPLDSLSLNRNTMTYFVEKGDNKYDTTEENIMIGECRNRVIRFLKNALGIIESQA